MLIIKGNEMNDNNEVKLVNEVGETKMEGKGKK